MEMQRRYSVTCFDIPLASPDANNATDDANDVSDPATALAELTDQDLAALLTAAETSAPRRRPMLRLPGHEVPAHYRPKPSRVDWRPIAERIGNAGRDWRHSGRPDQEQVPRLPTMKFEKLLRSRPEGTVVRAEAADAGLAVDVRLSGNFGRQGGRVRLLWQVEPLIGQAVENEQIVAMTSWNNGMSQLYRATCPTCSRTARDLFWAVSLFCCASCLGLRRRSADDRKYALEKASQKLRAKLKLERQVLGPVVVKSVRHIPLAKRLLEVEAKLVARTVGEGS